MTDLLDLDYADPRPPVDLAARARRQGVARRRRRRVGAMGGVAALAVCGMAAMAAVSGPAWWSPVVAGPGASDRSLASASASPVAVSSSVDELATMRPRGEVHTVMAWRDGQDVVVYIGRNGYFCIGYRAPVSGIVTPSLCSPLENLPRRGLWNIGAYSPGNTELDPGLAVGVATGGVTRVVIETAQGTVDAELAEEPGVGTLYWAHVGSFGQSGSMRRTAYYGTLVVSTCLGSACNSTHG